MKSFLQTTDWFEFQKSIGRKAWRFDNGKIIANVIRHDLPLNKNYLYIPHGPQINLDQITGGLKNELENFIFYLRKIAKEEGSIFIKIEPLQDSVIELIYGAGFKKSSKEIQPKRSVILDLSKSELELSAEMHHKTRYNIKVSEKHNIEVKPSDDINVFLDLLEKTSKRDKFYTHPKSYYKKLFEFFRKEDGGRADILLAFLGNEPIAGAMVLSMGDTCYYLHGASDYDRRSYMAPYKLHWEIIKYFKQKGLSHYDLWGIDANKWPGVTRFKLGWDGRQVEYPGAFDMSFRPFWFLVYKILRRIF